MLYFLFTNIVSKILHKFFCKFATMLAAVYKPVDTCERLVMFIVSAELYCPCSSGT